MDTIESDAWVPICAVCQTQTISALRGEHRCVNCDRVWDGSETSERVDGRQERDGVDKQVVDDLVAILTYVLRKEALSYGYQRKSRPF